MPATFGRRRQTKATLRKPVLGTRAQFYPRIRTRLVAVSRASQRLRSIHPSRTRVVGRAVALLRPYAIQTVTDQANRSQSRKRSLRNRLGRPLRFVPVIGKAIKIRIALVARGAVRDRRRATLPRLRRPIGRALARTVPYRIKVFLSGRAVRDRRRAIRSLRMKALGVYFPRIVQRVKVYLAGRTVRDRRRAIGSRVRRPIGRALARLYPYRVRVLLAGRAVSRRRSLRSRLRGPLRQLVAIFPRRVRVYLGRGAIRDRRRSLKTRLGRPVGRALALLRPYAVRTLGRIARGSVNRRRRWRSLLRHPIRTLTVQAPTILGDGFVSSVAANVGEVTSVAATVARISSAGSLAVFPYPRIVFDDAAEAYLRLSEASGLVAADATGHGHNGAISATGISYGTAGLLAGDPDKAMSLNGTTGKIDIPYHAALNAGVFTVEVWFYKLSTPASNNPLWDCRPASSGANAAGFDLFLNVGAGIGLSICRANQAQTLIVTSAIPNFERHHAIGCYDGTQARIFIDGVLRAGPTSCLFTPNPTAASALGHLTGGANFSNVILDEVAYYGGISFDVARALRHFLAGSIAAATGEVSSSEANVGVIGSYAVRDASAGSQP